MLPVGNSHDCDIPVPVDHGGNAVPQNAVVFYKEQSNLGHSQSTNMQAYDGLKTKIPASNGKGSIHPLQQWSLIYYSLAILSNFGSDACEALNPVLSKQIVTRIYPRNANKYKGLSFIFSPARAKSSTAHSASSAHLKPTGPDLS